MKLNISPYFFFVLLFLISHNSYNQNYPPDLEWSNQVTNINAGGDAYVDKVIFDNNSSENNSYPIFKSRKL